MGRLGFDALLKFIKIMFVKKCKVITTFKTHASFTMLSRSCTDHKMTRTC